MKSPKITVYIISHNYGQYLNEAINSVLRQSMDEWELFLINNGSVDNTQEIMETYSGNPRVKIFNWKKRGLPSIANFVLKEAAAPYIIRLDADDVFDENILLVLSNYLDKHPEMALVFPDYYLVDEYGGLIQHEKRNSLFQNNHMFDMPAHGACTMIRRDILKEVGGYSEDLNAQDGLDIWTKVINKHKCGNVNLPLFFYRRHGKNLTDNVERILNARRSIKKSVSEKELYKHKPIISIIPCRKHYDIYPNLWSKKLNGETLLDKLIKVNIASSIFDAIVITADTDEVYEIIKKYDDERLAFVPRDSKLTIPSSNIVETIEMVLKELGYGWNGISVLSYIQAPFTTTENLEEAVHTLVMNNADSAFAVEEISLSLFKRSANGLVPLNNMSMVRSDFDLIYADARTSLATKNENIRTGSLTGAKLVNFVVPKEETFFINSKKDFEIASCMFKSKSL